MTKPNTSLNVSRWDLADLFPSAESPEIEAAFAHLEEKTTAFEEVRSQLNEDLSIEIFLGYIHQLEEINHLARRISSFIHLWFTEDTQNQSAQSQMARVDQYLAELNNHTLFFSLWWKILPDHAAKRMMESAGDYHYWLEEMRHFKEFTLSEPEEKIINIKDVTGAKALTMLYDSITNRYIYKFDVKGEMRELTRGELTVFARHYDADLRAGAYQELYRVYGDDGPILGQIYQALVRDWRNEQMNLRGFDSPIAARNLINDLPDEVVDMLLEVCERNTSVFQRFFTLKARWLGMDRLRRYDIYAPVAESKKHYSFSQAADMVLESFREFDPHLSDLAQQVFNMQHIDSEIRKGKLSGAFCLSPGPDLTPWVMLNYQGKSSDVTTMAHELGHAIHSMLAADHSIFTFHACLPLAETASTFGEMMLVDKLLQEETDEELRRDLLFNQVDDAYAHIQRQAFFAMFERQAHNMINEGASVDELAEAYQVNLHKQFGTSIEVSDEFRWEWVSIPHIYNVPFYVYAYSFGQLLVLSLFKQYKNEGEAFKPRYLKILAAGGSKAPMRVLADAGIDVHQASFWQGGFDMIDDQVKQLEAIPLGKITVS